MLKLSRTILVFLGLSAFDNLPALTTLAVVTTGFATGLLFAILATAFVGVTALTFRAGLDLLFTTTLAGNDLLVTLGFVAGMALTAFLAFVVTTRSKSNVILKNVTCADSRDHIVMITLYTVYNIIKTRKKIYFYLRIFNQLNKYI